MKLIKLVLIWGLISFYTSTTIADIAISNHSSNSIMLTSNESENKKEYILEITVEGVDPRLITLEPHGQMLILNVNDKGGRAQTARSSSQNITYTYSFSDDADIHNLLRVNTRNRIRISIPKHNRSNY